MQFSLYESFINILKQEIKYPTPHRGEVVQAVRVYIKGIKF